MGPRENTNPLKDYYDYTGDFGGPIIRDKLWFYGGIGKQTLTGFISRQPKLWRYNRSKEVAARGDSIGCSG